MKRTLGNTLAVAGLAAGAFLPGNPAVAEAPPVFDEPAVAEPFYYEPGPMVDTNWDFRRVEVRDHSASSLENAVTGTPREVKDSHYQEAEQLMERSMLGRVAVSFSRPQTVVITRDVSTELCTYRMANDTAGWGNAMTALQAEADGKLPPTDGADFDTTVYEFNFEVCHPLNTAVGKGGQSSVAGDASFGGPVRIFDNLNAEVIAHETEHWAGLNHSDALECALQDVSPGLVNEEIDYEDCMLVEYGDSSTVMGNMPTDRDGLNGQQLGRLGLLERDQIQSVTRSGTYELGALLNEGTDDTKLLRIPLGEDSNVIAPLLNEANRPEDADYLPEQGEYLTIELSGEPFGQKGSPLECYNMEILDFEEDVRCSPNEVTVKLGLAGGLNLGGSGHTIRLDANPEPHHYGAGEDQEGRMIYSRDGIEITLEDIQSSPENDATGTASVRVTVPQ